MNNHDIEKNIQSAFSKMQPDQLNQILSDCNTQKGTILMTNEQPRTSFSMTHFLGFALACLLLVGAIFISNGANPFNAQHKAVAATISLDVNPSIEIKINDQQRVLEVLPMNEDAKVIVGDMDFSGSDLKVTVNALIGSLVTHGYLDDLANSILVTVEDATTLDPNELETLLANEISNLFENGSILTTFTKDNAEVKEMATTYGITTGKAQLVKELVDGNPFYTVEDLVALSVNDLNLLKKDATSTKVQRTGTPSDKAYIGTAKAKEIALKDAGLKEADVTMEKVELDYEHQTMVYEVDFLTKDYEYDYEIDATTGEILQRDKDALNKTKTPVNNQQSSGSSNNNSGGSSAPAQQSSGNNTQQQTTSSGLITEAQAKTIAFNYAGVSANQVSGLILKSDMDDGIPEYEIEFMVDTTEYDVEIDARNGNVISFDKEVEDDYVPAPAQQSSGSSNSSGSSAPAQQSSGSNNSSGSSAPAQQSSGGSSAPASTPSVIGNQSAANIALSHAGVGQANELEVELDGNKYEVSFKANGYEYDYDIDAYSGGILKAEKDYDD